MIKANELRIGNLVQNGYRTVIVCALFKSHFKCETIKQITLDSSLQLNFEGIPLTEEWILKKMNFEKDKSVTHIDCYKLYYSLSEYIYINNIGGKKEPLYTIGLCSNHTGFVILESVKGYVHSIQNLYFIVAGKELTIKLD